jgi:hypothetical protein
MSVSASGDAPLFSWVGNTWLSGERAYTVEEMRVLFADECTLFVGDSLQRRGGDTLFLLLDNKDTHDIPTSIFTDKYFNSKQKDRGRMERPVPGATRSGSCLDFEWRPTLADLVNFTTDFVATPEIYDKYTLVIAGSAVWDSCRQYRLDAPEVSRRTNSTINALQDLVVKKQKNFSVIWKTSGWADADDGTNDKIRAANEQAISSIEQIQKENPPDISHQLTYLDWGKHVYARSFSDRRILSGDGNPYHYGLEPRLVLLQMLSLELDKRKPHLMNKNSATDNSSVSGFSSTIGSSRSKDVSFPIVQATIQAISFLATLLVVIHHCYKVYRLRTNKNRCKEGDRASDAKTEMLYGC